MAAPTDSQTPPSHRWQERRIAAFIVRALIFAVPLIAGFAAGTWVARALPEPERVSQVLMWWVLTIAVASAAATVVDRIGRRFLPLSTLLKMSMLFPDEAPSRLNVARRSGSMSELKRRIAAVELGGDRAEAEAAELILSLSAALGRHDRKTRGHSERVRAYVDMIAEQLGLPQGDRDRLRWVALLHDIGKLEISGDILNKEGALDADEWHAIRQHPILGLQMISPIVPWLGPWAETIAHHHERYDGSGYPFGFAGTEIAYGARIVAVADAYDVMTSGRSYQRAKSPDQARREIVAMSGTQFDPKVARALMKVAIGRLRWATGPLAAIAQFPWSRGLPALGRDAITLIASSALMTTALVTGSVPTPGDFPARDVVEIVIAGAELTTDAIGAIVNRTPDDGLLVAADPNAPTAPGTGDTDGTGSVPPTNPDEPGDGDGEGSTGSVPPGSETTTMPPGGSSTTSPATSTTTSPRPTTTPTTSPRTTTTTRPQTTTTTRPATTTTTTRPQTTTTTQPPPTTTTTTTRPQTTTTTQPPPTTTTTTTVSAVVANPDSAGLKKNGSVIIRVLGNDTGPVDPNSVSIISGPAHGSVSIVGGSGKIRYSAGPSTGSDSFEYQVCGLSGGCSRTVVALDVD